jgi:hypothetical protein
MNPAGAGKGRGTRIPWSLAAAGALAAGSGALAAAGAWPLALGAAVGALLLVLPRAIGPRPWSFAQAMLLTRSGDLQSRRAGAASLASNAEGMSDAQADAAALRMGELADDPDPEMRWIAAMVLDALAPRLRGPTRSALFGRALQLAEDPFDRARGAAVVALAALAGGDGGGAPAAARSPIERLLKDPSPTVRMWALDAAAKAAPLMDTPDRKHLTLLVMEDVVLGTEAVAWKAGRTLVAMTRGAPPGLDDVVVDGLLARASDVGGDRAVVHIDLVAELKPRLDSAAASEAVRRLIARAEEDTAEVGLRALRAAAILASAARIEVGDPSTQALARIATGTDALRRDGALFCLGAIGSWAGAFGKALHAEGASQLGQHLVDAFHSEDAFVRRWARDMWPLAYGAAAPGQRDALLDLLVNAHFDPSRNVRSAASASLTAVRPSLTAVQARRMADALIMLLRHPDGDTKRLTTVTLVELFEVLEEDKRADVVAALRALAADPDRVVADQARDSIAAIGEFREKRAKAHARAT